MEDNQIKEQIEKILGVTVDTGEKSIEDEVKEILNLGDEE